MTRFIDLDPSNPYTDTIKKWQNGIKRYSESGDEQVIAGVKAQTHIIKEWLPVTFSRIYHHKEVLGDLSSEACKIFMYIALNIGHNDQTIHIKREHMKLSKRKFSRAMVELMAAQVIAKVLYKRQRYWVNLTIIVCGKLKQQEEQ